MPKQILWRTFSIQLNNLDTFQSEEVQKKLAEIQRMFEQKFNTDGGDHVGVDAGVFNA